jgi:hypothetical protein
MIDLLILFAFLCQLIDFGFRNVSCFSQAAFVIVLHWTDQSAFQSRPSAKTIVVSAVFQLLQVMWIAISSYRMVYFIIHDVVAPGVFVNMCAAPLACIMFRTVLSILIQISEFAPSINTHYTMFCCFLLLPGTWPT